MSILFTFLNMTCPPKADTDVKLHLKKEQEEWDGQKELHT